ncbi:MAG: hypothetical protein Q9217_003543 [Psora testacea]
MPKDPPDDDNIETEQSLSLLQNPEDRGPEPSQAPQRPRPQFSGRQSSFSKPPANGGPRVPRTPNRVRFEIEEREGSEHELNGFARSPNIEGHLEEDGLANIGFAAGRSNTGQRAPLLTAIEAPSVVIARQLDFNAEDLLENARPKSGMKSAFMNMANSIIGAGIIGQPYAFRQAGLTAGIILLVGLTATVDWTIRLIIINSKLSGANSFQDKL